MFLLTEEEIDGIGAGSCGAAGYMVCGEIAKAQLKKVVELLEMPENKSSSAIVLGFECDFMQQLRKEAGL